MATKYIDQLSTATAIDSTAHFLVEQSAGAIPEKAPKSLIEGLAGAPFADDSALVKNASDATKLGLFDAQYISTGTTRTYTLPNADWDFRSIVTDYVASTVNAFKVQTSATGNAVALSVDGTDTNVDLQLSGKGTGDVLIDSLRTGDETELTISSGVVTVTRGRHSLDTESDASSDDLDTINGGADGLLVILRANNDGRTVVLKNGTGNIECSTSADITLDDDNKLALAQYDTTLTKWLVAPLFGSGGGGGITSLGGLSGATQTFGNDTNVTMVSSGSAHTLTWSGTLSHERGGLEADVSSYSGVALINSGSTSEIKYNMASASDPTTSDDTGSGYIVGSRWLNTTSDHEFVCLDNTSSAAVWKSTTASSSGVTDGSTLATGLTFPNTGLHLLDTGASFDLIVAPGSSLTADRTLTITTGDADRTLTINNDVTLVKNNYTATSAPTTSDDTGSGYEPGSEWVDVTNDKAYVCLDATSTAAVWTETTQSGGGGSSKWTDSGDFTYLTATTDDVVLGGSSQDPAACRLQVTGDSSSAVEHLIGEFNSSTNQFAIWDVHGSNAGTHGDVGYVSMMASNLSGTSIEGARQTWGLRDATASSEDGTWSIDVAVAGTSTERVRADDRGVFLHAPSSAPADAALSNGQISFSIDETNDEVDVKVKESGGTVFTVTIGGGGGSGDVTGPGSSTDNAIARFDGTTGKIIQNSTDVVITDAGQLALTNSAFLSSEGSSSQAPLRISESSAAPSSGVNNDMYLDDGTNTASGSPGFRRYTGSAWEDVGAVSGGSSLFTDSGAFTYLTSTTDDLIIGASSQDSGAKFEVQASSDPAMQLDSDSQQIAILDHGQSFSSNNQMYVSMRFQNASSSMVEYARIQAQSTSTTASSESGEINLRIMDGGTMYDALRVGHVNSDTAVDAQADLFLIECTTDSTATAPLTIYGNARSTAADNDKASISLELVNSVASNHAFAQLYWVAYDVTDATEDGGFGVQVYKNGTETDSARFTYKGAEFQNGTVTTTKVAATSNLGATPTVDWNDGNRQQGTLNASITTLTFTAPTDPSGTDVDCTCTWKVTQDGTGSHTITWSGVTFANAAPQAADLNSTASKATLFKFERLDGEWWYLGATQEA